MDIKKIKQDFRLLKRKIRGKNIYYLDSTATALKPNQVIEKANEYNNKYTANVFRGIYSISEKATAEYEGARTKIADFIGGEAEEIVFTRNTTESINLVYYSYALHSLKKGDEIVTTILEHHSNFVPWQELQKKNGVKLNIYYIKNDWDTDFRNLQKIITKKTKLVAITSASNVLGTMIDIEKLSGLIKEINPKCKILIDAAQSVPHARVNVKKWNVDFVAFSGHKMLGPSGIGVLWARKKILEDMPPFQLGGDMISEVHVENTIFNSIPHKFEAGTPNISGAIGLGAAVDYLSKIGMDNVRSHEIKLTDYATRKMSKIKGLNLLGPRIGQKKGGVISFTLDKIHPHDVAQVLDTDNIFVRVGYHCAQPLHEYIGCGPTVRASFYIYNTFDDIDKLVEGLEKVKKIFE